MSYSGPVEGMAHAPTAIANGLTIMPALRYGGMDSRLGKWGYDAHEFPAKAIQPVCKYFRTIPPEDRIIDMGGHAILRCMTDASNASVFHGLNSGCFPCKAEVDRVYTSLRTLVDAFGSEMTLWWDCERFPAVDQPEFKPVVDLYKRGNTVTDAQLQARSLQAIVGVAQTIARVHGINPKRVVVGGASAPDVDCPINHLWAGGITPGFATWSEHWVHMEQTLDRISRSAQGRPTWMHFAADMPPEQAAFGYALAMRCGVEKVPLFADNAIPPAELAPKIAAVVGAMRSASA